MMWSQIEGGLPTGGICGLWLLFLHLGKVCVIYSLVGIMCARSRAAGVRVGQGPCSLPLLHTGVSKRREKFPERLERNGAAHGGQPFQTNYKPI